MLCFVSNLPLLGAGGGGFADCECFCFTGATMCELYELGGWEGGAGELGGFGVFFGFFLLNGGEGNCIHRRWMGMACFELAGSISGKMR